MTINKRLSDYYLLAARSGYQPKTIGVTQEEHNEYLDELKKLAEVNGFVFTDEPSVLTYNGIKLEIYGKKHTDEKLKARKERKIGKV